MTREEAKRILYVYRAVNLVDASHREAFDMAIEALEQEPCADAISREDALMALTGEYMESSAEILPKAIKRINALPPVNPAEKVGRWIARGLVDINGNRIYECSECHHSDTQAATMIVPYCWYCGRRMMQDVEE